MIQNNVLKLIKWSLWEQQPDDQSIDWDTFIELRDQTIAALVSPVLPRLSMPFNLKTEWRNEIIKQLSFYTSYECFQSKLPITVPYVILKGSSAAQYYPHPEFRTMGDIDIITRREDFNIAYQQLLENGFFIESESDREVGFRKNGFLIELHRFFASLNVPDQAKYLDDMIINNITPSHVLPDINNGLVFLEHISQHLEHGLGLRQIIDWMLFVNKCLPDEKWADFSDLAENIGLKNLAIITTRMCELYLGLPERNWCKAADPSICRQLIEYVLASGNFGNKWIGENAVGQTVFTYIMKPITAIRWFQERGLLNWQAAQRHAYLRPFAWIYQMGRYLKRGINQDGSLSSIRMEYNAAKRRIAMFDALGVKQKTKGLVIYRNGEYVKK